MTTIGAEQAGDHWRFYAVGETVDDVQKAWRYASIEVGELPIATIDMTRTEDGGYRISALTPHLKIDVVEMLEDWRRELTRPADPFLTQPHRPVFPDVEVCKP